MKKRLKNIDKLNYKDFLQVLGGSIFGSIIVFFTKTIAPPSIASGIYLGILSLVAVFLIIHGIMKKFHLTRLLLFLLTAFIVSYIFSSLIGLILEEVTIKTLISLDYFTTTSFVSMLLGMSTGAAADALKD